jgi:hypothetical protein
MYREQRETLEKILYYKTYAEVLSRQINALMFELSTIDGKLRELENNQSRYHLVIKDIRRTYRQISFSYTK